MLNHQQAVPKSKLSSGSTADKHHVMLDDGKTVVYIAEKAWSRRSGYGMPCVSDDEFISISPLL
jgi:hypothetical protein